MNAPDSLLTIGRISGLFGLQGSVRVHAQTENIELPLQFKQWQLLLPQGKTMLVTVAKGRSQGGSLIVRFQGYSTPEEATHLIGATIQLDRRQLPPPDEDEYYWIDLVGCQVEKEDGMIVGHVDHLFETGANDVMAVLTPEGEERLFPFTQEIVLAVDLPKRRIVIAIPPGL